MVEMYLDGELIAIGEPLFEKEHVKLVHVGHMPHAQVMNQMVIWKMRPSFAVCNVTGAMAKDL